MKQSEGILPHCGWLVANGYSALDIAMRKYPEMFAHIQQEDRRGHTDKQAVAQAEALSKETGSLHNPQWLRDNGYKGLAGRMRLKPWLFSHLKQTRLLQTDAFMVQLAEKLAKGNGGMIPNTWWLQKNHCGLARRILVKPHLFKHLKQLRLDNRGKPTNAPRGFKVSP